MPESSYIGSELEIFQHAVNWKGYYGNLIRQYLGAEVLEVGAGIGATTEILVTEQQKHWVCLEPDNSLAEEIVKKISEKKLPSICEARVGEVSHLADEERFDSVVYIDVLEHIENDKAEISRAAKHIRPGGHLVVLSPAHEFLYTPFDKAIGHFRRYSKSKINNLVDGTGLKPVRSIYLDSVGTVASLANKLLLRSSMPSKKQIRFWDRFLVPASRVTDKLTLGLVGKSILGIWQRPKN